MLPLRSIPFPWAIGRFSSRSPTGKRSKIGRHDALPIYRETYRAMQILKRALPFYASAPLDSIPLGYWKILFPQPYWETIEDRKTRRSSDLSRDLPCHADLEAGASFLCFRSARFHSPGLLEDSLPAALLGNDRRSEDTTLFRSIARPTVPCRS